MVMIHTAATEDRYAPDTRRTGGNLYHRIGKRGFDIALAIAAIPTVAPIILLLWVIVACDGGKGFFGHKRVGHNGRVFRCWKLRTMVVDAESVLRDHLAANPEAAQEWQREYKLTNDPRITKIGRFLRRTSLDELPQLWNVLVGDMSFVGPRPVVRYELHKYAEHRTIYKSLRPGITGLWQVSGRNELTYGERVQLDLAYSEGLSLLLDIRLLLLTGISILSATGR